MKTTTTPPPALFETNEFEKFAAGLRAVAWLWILGAAAVFAVQLDLASVLAVGLSGILAMELAEVAALVLGPGTLGLALSSVIERVSYLTSDLSLF